MTEISQNMAMPHATKAYRLTRMVRHTPPPLTLTEDDTCCSLEPQKKPPAFQQKRRSFTKNLTKHTSC